MGELQGDRVCGSFMFGVRWNREEMLLRDLEALGEEACAIFSPPRAEKPSEVCLVCHEENVFHALNCGHGLCHGCWKGTLSARLDGEGGNVLLTACPMKVCQCQMCGLFDF